MKILIVDDNEKSLYLLERLLKGHGHEVRLAENGAAALEQLGSDGAGVNLIVSDILMPGMDGFQFCKKLKADERLRSIPLIIYTATYTGPQDEAFALKIGADRFLVKPCEPEIFLAMMNEVIDVAKTRKSVEPNSLVSEEESLKLYNERLVRKLEQKMFQAEREIRAREEAEQELLESKARLVAAQKLARMGDFIWDVETGEVTWSEALYELLGYSSSDAIGYDQVNTEIHHPDDLERITKWLNDSIESGGSELPPNEYRILCKDGQEMFVQAKGKMKRVPGRKPLVFGTVQDITERKRAEAEHEKLQTQLIQAQKMESIGRLAGGVAHDFNNMLTVIIGSAEMALDKVKPDDPLHDDLQQILDAAGRSADITRQLLAFARKQTINPKVLDLNETVEGTLKMIRRLIGEDIDLVWHPGLHLAPVYMDASQLTQVLANLCVNARDAIVGVGKILIETANVVLDAEYCNKHEGFVPGRFVLLSVSDEGCGMDAQTLAKIFEPFFTTKGVGKGTGLGLATVYGIVKQNNGFINVYSEPGDGTTFKIFLPRYESDTKSVQTGNGEAGAKIPRAREEVVLIVEDEAAILNLSKAILTRLGYTVLTAGTPSEALRIAKSYNGVIHLLLTDMVMPEMNGRDLAERLRAERPHLKVLFMSGYTSDVIGNKGVLEDGIHFIQKPFSLDRIASKLREVLDEA